MEETGADPPDTMATCAFCGAPHPKPALRDWRCEEQVRILRADLTFKDVLARLPAGAHRIRLAEHKDLLYRSPRYAYFYCRYRICPDCHAICSADEAARAVHQRRWIIAFAVVFTLIGGPLIVVAVLFPSYFATAAPGLISIYKPYVSDTPITPYNSSAWWAKPEDTNPDDRRAQDMRSGLP